MKSNGDGQLRKTRAPRARGWHRLARHRAEPSGSVEELAAQLAPLEEQAARSAQAGAENHDGAIVVDTGKLKLPEGIGAGDAGRFRPLGFEPVVLVILALMLAFILFIAWQISLMPESGG
ncbi:MAG: hypothetical protein M3268_00120 [Acidobacteriota bacterium]|nr:hypothetical protein [Acidobacteriota bacterium]